MRFRRTSVAQILLVVFIAISDICCFINIGLDIKEGSVLLFDGGVYTADEDSEALRRKKIFEMQQKLKSRG